MHVINIEVGEEKLIDVGFLPTGKPEKVEGKRIENIKQCDFHVYEVTFLMIILCSFFLIIATQL